MLSLGRRSTSTTSTTQPERIKEPLVVHLLQGPSSDVSLLVLSQTGSGEETLVSSVSLAVLLLTYLTAC